MRLSSMADYAVVTMCAAARHCGFSRVSAVELAQETGLPVPTVQKLVTLLSRAGLIRGLRGAGGGLYVSAPAAELRIATLRHYIHLSGATAAHINGMRATIEREAVLRAMRRLRERLSDLEPQRHEDHEVGGRGDRCVARI